MITIIGDDRAGLVEALSGSIAANGGNWERSQLAELGGKFAGVVLISVPESSLDSLTADLDRIESLGLLHVSITDAVTAAGRPGAGARLAMRLVGQDHPGIVHEISHALAHHQVSIEELDTAVVPAPMGGMLFEASAVLVAPPGLSIGEVRDTLEALAQDLMVDLEFEET